MLFWNTILILWTQEAREADKLIIILKSRCPFSSLSENVQYLGPLESTISKWDSKTALDSIETASILTFCIWLEEDIKLNSHFRRPPHFFHLEQSSILEVWNAKLAVFTKSATKTLKPCQNVVYVSVWQFTQSKIFMPLYVLTAVHWLNSNKQFFP